MSQISVFDVIGPNMIGPSSSHTAGASRISYLARKILGGKLEHVKFILYGSFARTYNGHGTDRALLGGIMGFETDDIRIRDSFKIAEEKNIEFEFETDDTDPDVYPNTVDILMDSEDGSHMEIRGESIGGGKVRIVRIDDVPVDFTGEYSSLIVVHEDVPGVVTHITKCLSERDINIAFMRLFREGKREKAYTIVETDSQIPDEIRKAVMDNKNIDATRIINAS